MWRGLKRRSCIGRVGGRGLGEVGGLVVWFVWVAVFFLGGGAEGGEGGDCMLWVWFFFFFFF